MLCVLCTRYFRFSKGRTTIEPNLYFVTDGEHVWPYSFHRQTMFYQPNLNHNIVLINKYKQTFKKSHEFDKQYVFL